MSLRKFLILADNDISKGLVMILRNHCELKIYGIIEMVMQNFEESEFFAPLGLNPSKGITNFGKQITTKGAFLRPNQVLTYFPSNVQTITKVTKTLLRFVCTQKVKASDSILQNLVTLLRMTQTQ